MLKDNSVGVFGIHSLRYLKVEFILFILCPIRVLSTFRDTTFVLHRMFGAICFSVYEFLSLD